MNSSTAPGLHFRFRELVEEIQTLRTMAGAFLMTDGTGILTKLKSDLERIGEMSTESPQTLQLPPLRTISTQSYEAGERSGGLEIYACMTGVWELLPVGPRRPKRAIAFVGKASAVVELWPKEHLWCEEHHPADRLAMWRIELGAHGSPGCYFHIQILGDCDESPFPKSVPIPRLPSPFVTPMAAIEFVLGELFQDGWPQKASEDRPDHQRWRSIQRERWERLLMWQGDALTSGTSSPWMNLKHAEPPDHLFVSS